MDGERLDAFVKAIAELHSRRAVLRVAGGVGLGSLSGLLGFAGSDARKRRKCKGNTKRCGKRCIAKTACCRCPAGTFCQHGGCFRGCAGATPTGCVVGGACTPGACLSTVAGPNVCGSLDCAAAQPCANDGGRPAGQTCAESGCCTEFGKPKTCGRPASA